MWIICAVLDTCIMLHPFHLQVDWLCLGVRSWHCLYCAHATESQTLQQSKLTKKLKWIKPKNMGLTRATHGKWMFLFRAKAALTGNKKTLPGLSPFHDHLLCDLCSCKQGFIYIMYIYILYIYYIYTIYIYIYTHIMNYVYIYMYVYMYIYVGSCSLPDISSEISLWAIPLPAAFSDTAPPGISCLMLKPAS